MTSKFSRIAFTPAAALTIGLVASCAPALTPMVAAPAAPAQTACRTPITPDGTGAVETIRWSVPVISRTTLDAWCGTTGPPVIDAQPGALTDGGDDVELEELVVVTWNVHVGAADVATLVGRLRAGAFTHGRPVEHFVLLLQEAYRADPRVPRVVAADVKPPRAIRTHTTGHARADVVRVARSEGLALYYVPSMRNGAPDQTDEDRGNAILSTEPLSSFTAIELPFERQRRVAVAATVSGSSGAGGLWTLNLASAHLESTASARRLWVLATGVRTRQAGALLGVLQANEPLVLGGDFNTWFGFSDPTYRTIAGVIPDAARRDRRSTFPPFFRLDHLFSRAPDGWSVTAARLDDRFGSDHYPILGRFLRTSGRD